MKLTKKDILNYLIDCKGYTEEEANQQISIYGHKCLDENQLKECMEYND